METTSPPSRLAALAYPVVLVGAVGLAAALLDRGLSPGLVTTAVFVAALAVTSGLERVMPHRRAWYPTRADLALDGQYVALMAGTQVVARNLATLLAALVAVAFVTSIGPRHWPLAWPLRGQVPLALALADFGKYWLHRLAHTRAWLWRFHAAHHAPDRMYALNGVRLHPINALWNLVLDAGVPLALGLDGRAVVLAASFRAAVGVLQHADVALPPGPLDWLLSTPVLHQWHHSTATIEADANYGSTFIVWDVVFGTRRLPRDRGAPDALGLADGARHPARLAAQLAWPWHAASRSRRVVVAIIALVVAAGPIALFRLAPAVIEEHFNHTLARPVAPVGAHARALHARLTIVDLHADSLLWERDLLARGDRGHVDVPRLVEGNVALQAFTIVTRTPRGHNIDRNADDSDNITLLAIAEGWPPSTWTDLTARARYQAAKLDEVARRSRGRFVVIRRASELAAYLARRAADPTLSAGFLGVEGAHALGGDLGNIEALFAAGVRMMAPTHFTDNDIGGSASGVGHTGLSAKGSALVREMEARGMIVDLAHASARTIDDVLSIATRPVVVSHTGVRGTCDNARNLDDAQLVAIARTGGVVGIGYWGHAVCTVDAASIARAIVHAVRVAGVDHVALGSDFDGTTTTPFDASGLVALTDALITAGLDDDAIAKVMGGNALRVLLATLPP